MTFRFCQRLRNLVVIMLGVVLGCTLIPPPAASHDVPEQMVLRAFVKPEGERLHVLVRIPLALMLNIGMPKRGPGYLDLGQIDEAMSRAADAAARALPIYENDIRILPDSNQARISQPSEDAFGSFEQAAKHISGPPLPETANVFWNQGYFDLRLGYPITSPDSRFALDMLAGTFSDRTKLVVEFLPPGGSARTYHVHGGYGWLDLDPAWYRAAWTFVQLGFQHILDGTDHLLFLFCLILPFRLRQFWTLAVIITSFTVAHSITLIAGAMGVVPSGAWFPPLVEALIAMSIVYMAIENILIMWIGEESSFGNLRWRWLLTGAFGLIHGFGFSFVLQQDLQLAGSHFLLSLLAFNVGVELGQLAVLLLVMPFLALLLRQPRAQRAGVVIFSALVAHTAWHWMIERIEALRFVRWPTMGPEEVAGVVIGATALIVIGWGVWRTWLASSRPSHVTEQPAWGLGSQHSGGDRPESRGLP